LNSASAPSFDPSLLTREGLEGLRRRALRSKAWFRLERLERAVVELTIKVVDRVKNATLAGIILPSRQRSRRFSRAML
jgi:hypothetical protein